MPDDHTLLYRSPVGPINPGSATKAYDPFRTGTHCSGDRNFFAIAVSTPRGPFTALFIEVARAPLTRLRWAHHRVCRNSSSGVAKTSRARATSAVSRFRACASGFSENRIQVVVTAPAMLMPAIEVAEARLRW